MFKGWYQTLIVLYRDPLRLLRELGQARCVAALLVLISYALAPLAGPACALWLGADIALGRLSSPSDPLQIWLATLWVSVFLAGLAGHAAARAHFALAVALALARLFFAHLLRRLDQHLRSSEAAAALVQDGARAGAKFAASAGAPVEFAVAPKLNLHRFPKLPSGG
jgi:hypothetical protein